MSSSNSELPPFEPSSQIFRYTEPPNASWKYGEPVDATEEGRKWMEGTKGGWKTVDPATSDWRYVYGLLLSGVAPRPVAFVSTIAEDGTENLAPYSWFNTVSPSPAIISIAIGTGVGKDTARNIVANKQFTVNIISEPWLQQSNIASTDMPGDTSEWPLTGLTKQPSTVVKPALVKESAFSMECELYDTVDIRDPESGIQKALLVLGLIKKIHIRNDILDERGMADPGRLMPVMRMGGITYGRVTEGYRISRKVWAQDADTIPQELKLQTNSNGVRN